MGGWAAISAPKDVPKADVLLVFEIDAGNSVCRLYATMPIASGRSGNRMPKQAMTHCLPVSHVQGSNYEGMLLKMQRDIHVKAAKAPPLHFASELGPISNFTEEQWVSFVLEQGTDLFLCGLERVICRRLLFETADSLDVLKVTGAGLATESFVVERAQLGPAQPKTGAGVDDDWLNLPRPSAKKKESKAEAGGKSGAKDLALILVNVQGGACPSAQLISVRGLSGPCALNEIGYPSRVH